jgi:methylphosphotriester-DNA--protein-cysteine methyltransferase
VDGPIYKEWAPAPALAGYLDCLWFARAAGDGTPHTDRVLPDGCVDIVWDGASVFVAGPDTGPVPVHPRPEGVFAGARFRPGLAPTLLGLPASALRDQRVALGEMWDDDASVRLAEDLFRAAAAVPAVTAALEGCLIGRLPDAAPADRLVGAAVHRLSGRPGPAAVSRLAADLGVTERTLHRRVSTAVGYGPKTLERVLRFRRFLTLAGAGGGSAAGLAHLAAAAGYADQAHLTRDCVELSGLTPKVLVATRTGGVRSVQDNGDGPDADWDA